MALKIPSDTYIDLKPSYLYEVVAKHGFIQVTLGPKPSLAHFSLHNVQNMGRGVFCLEIHTAEGGRLFA